MTFLKKHFTEIPRDYNNNLYSLHKAHRYIKSKYVIIQKSTMTTSVYKNMIYRKLIEDKYVVKLRVN